MLFANHQVLERWKGRCEFLTQTVWRRYTPHAWHQSDKCEPLDAEYIFEARARLEEMARARTLVEQVARMLPSGERDALRSRAGGGGVFAAFDAFPGATPIYYNPYTQPLWKSAFSRFEHAVAPFVQRVAGKLRDRLRGLQGIASHLSDSIAQFSNTVAVAHLLKVDSVYA